MVRSVLRGALKTPFSGGFVLDPPPATSDSRAGNGCRRPLFASTLRHSNAAPPRETQPLVRRTEPRDSGFLGALALTYERLRATWNGPGFFQHRTPSRARGLPIIPHVRQPDSPYFAINRCRYSASEKLQNVQQFFTSPVPAEFAGPPPDRP